ncbi:cytochrome c family protein [Pelagibius sp. Alg239-R121]|uniref:c-type cytochrome n=1 Tax=Pelagibius sp. Alg239-R121 TaxID=2993448 RepID=UPI0024A73807|nr:c-type cytochrome [Pelagibius sp. Alg239-R121]
MKLRNLATLLLVFASFSFNALATRAADAERGARLYDSRCGACHSIEQNRIGPRHRGVFGRMAGTQGGYDYSQALVDSKILWDESSLDLWLTNPQTLIPGQKMGFRIRKAEDRLDIIAFLRSLAEKGERHPPGDGDF